MIKSIAVIGAGTMGSGIAHVFALHNFEVKLIDIDEMKLQQALDSISLNLDRQVHKSSIPLRHKQEALNNISTFTAIEEGVENVELVIEAATENVDLKLQIFKQLDTLTSSNCILATNTSSISITKMASVTKRPQSVIGMHFMNPVPIMQLVEIINGYNTDKNVTDIIEDLCKQIGKTPCIVNDYPGFVANRILMPMINEAIYTLHEGVAEKEEIDTIMKLGMSHPMGPLELADFIGLDVCLSILQILYEEFRNPKYAPCPLLVKMVDAERLGKKSGGGFYNYE